MTFLALLTKEMRSHLRRERPIWVIIAYLLILSALGFIFLQRANAFSGGYRVYLLGQLGAQLFALLALIQLLQVVLSAIAFTSTAINGEKAQETFDLLLCSKLSSFSLIGAELLAGLADVFLLIAASLPVFSLVYFFGGVSPAQVLSLLVVFAATALVTGMIGLCCSTLLRQPSVSNAVASTLCVVWLFAYWIVYYIIGGSLSNRANGQVWWMLWLNAWNPISAVNSIVNAGQGGAGSAFLLFRLRLAHWVAFTLISLIVTLVLFLLSCIFVKPNSLSRFFYRLRRLGKKTSASTT